MKAFPGLFAVLLTLAFSTQASAENKLFKEYAYNSQYSSYANKAEYYDCSEEMEVQALCIDDVPFAGHNYTAGLAFSENKLYTLLLFSEWSIERHRGLAGALNQSFSMLKVSNGNSEIDLIHEVRNMNNASELTAKINSFEALALGASNISYTYFEGKHHSKNAKNSGDALLKAPVDIRAAELFVHDNLIGVRFSFPKFEIRKLADSMKKPVESF